MKINPKSPKFLPIACATSPTSRPPTFQALPSSNLLPTLGRWVHDQLASSPNGTVTCWRFKPSPSHRLFTPSFYHCLAPFHAHYTPKSPPIHFITFQTLNPSQLFPHYYFQLKTHSIKHSNYHQIHLLHKISQF